MNIDELRFDSNQLVPVIVQDASSEEVLMFAFANREALSKTLATGLSHFYSRSREELWFKGGTSGNVQRLIEMRVDCDADAVLYRVESPGPACHTGAQSCFFNRINRADQNS